MLAGVGGLAHRSAVLRRHHASCRPSDEQNQLAWLERWIAMGNTTTEALRALKRRLFDVVYRRLLADAGAVLSASLGEAARHRREVVWRVSQVGRPG
jgi:hypothetical protein